MTASTASLRRISPASAYCPVGIAVIAVRHALFMRTYDVSQTYTEITTTTTTTTTNISIIIITHFHGRLRTEKNSLITNSKQELILK